MALLELKSLSLQIAGKQLCNRLDLSIERNECWGLLGKNGVGKTTLLHTILGLQPAQEGEILIDGQNTSLLNRQELARTMGILFQQGIDELPATVMETVMLGRYPHLQTLIRDTPADREIAEEALDAFELGALSNREITTLSGGERQRLALATLLTQAPDLFLLDEPSNHLDVAFQIKLLKILTDKISSASASFLMASHDINLTARFCDKILLLIDGNNYLAGDSEEILNEENLSRAYDCPIKSISQDGIQLFYPQ